MCSTDTPGALTVDSRNKEQMNIPMMEWNSDCSLQLKVARLYRHACLNKSNLIWPFGTFLISLMWYDFWLWQQEQHKKRDLKAHTVKWIHTLTIGGSATMDTVISSETVRRSAIIFWLALNAGSSKTGAPLSFKCVSSMPCPNLSPTICTQSLICNSCRQVCP